MRLGLGFHAASASGDSTPSLFPKFMAALSAMKPGQKNPVIMTLGDSTTFGSYSNGGVAGDLKSQSYPSQLAQMLNAGGLPSNARSIIANGSSVNEKSSSNDSRMVKGSSWGVSNVLCRAVGGYCVSHASTTYNPVTYSFEAVDHFRVWYGITPGGGNLIFSLNGLPAGSVSANGVDGCGLIDIPASALGNHTLSITTDSAGLVFILGVEATNSAKREIRIRNCGWAGSQTTAWIEAARPWSPASGLSAFAPDLSILCLGINDWVNGLNVTTFQTQIRSIIAGAKAQGDLLVMTPVPSDASVRAFSSQQGYVAAIKAAAIAENVPLLDMFSIFENYASANAKGWMGNVSHPSAMGYGVIAQKIYQLLQA